MQARRWFKTVQCPALINDPSTQELTKLRFNPHNLSTEFSPQLWLFTTAALRPCTKFQLQYFNPTTIYSTTQMTTQPKSDRLFVHPKIYLSPQEVDGLSQCDIWTLCNFCDLWLLYFATCDNRSCTRSHRSYTIMLEISEKLPRFRILSNWRQFSTSGKDRTLSKNVEKSG